MVYKCENCDRVYKNKQYLREHIEIKHSAMQSLKCVECDKHFSNKYSLKGHVLQVHPSTLHSCTFCGSSFKANRTSLYSIRR